MMRHDYFYFISFSLFLLAIAIYNEVDASSPVHPHEILANATDQLIQPDGCVLSKRRCRNGGYESIPVQSPSQLVMVPFLVSDGY